MKTSWRKVDEEFYGKGYDYTHHWGSASYIAELACHAAVEVSDLIREQEDEEGLASVQELREFFRDGELEKRVQTQEGLDLIDPGFAVLMNNVLKKAEYGGPYPTIYELAKGIDNLCRELRGLKELPKESLVHLRNTCLEISKAYSNYAAGLPRGRRLVA